jgi:hypothetical protein
MASIKKRIPSVPTIIVTSLIIIIIFPIILILISDCYSEIKPIIDGNDRAGFIITDWSSNMDLFLASYPLFIIPICGIVIPILCINNVITRLIPLNRVAFFRLAFIIDAFFRLAFIIVVIVLIVNILKYFLDDPVKIEMTYDSNEQELLITKYYPFSDKIDFYRVSIYDSSWLELSIYQDDCTERQSAYYKGNCCLFIDNKPITILFKGKPWIVCKTGEYLNKMTGLLTIKKNWIGMKMESNEVVYPCSKVKRYKKSVLSKSPFFNLSPLGNGHD